MSWLKDRILKFVNSPEKGVSSSQTLYELMFYALNRHQQSPGDSWFKTATLIADRIVISQLDDGGFNIGYDFIFGDKLSKKSDSEGTTPEVLCISALSQYLRTFEDRIDTERERVVKSAIKKGVYWILSHMQRIEDMSAVPYAPLSLKKIHITNATSFAISALSCSLQHLPVDMHESIKSELLRMYLFMKRQLVESSSGSYWPYFYLEDAGGFDNVNGKIDNYHIAQQLYHHFLAQEFFASDLNREILLSVSEYLLSIQDFEGFVPYTFVSGRANDKVDLWGYASLIPAFIEAYKYFGDKRFLMASEKALQYIFKYCTAGSHFCPIFINSKKCPLDTNFYPRSDAWVLHGVSSIFQFPDLVSSYHIDFSDFVCRKILSSDFSGLENHTATNRKRFFYWLVRLVRR